MGAWTIKMLRMISPEVRLRLAAWIFWVSIVLGVLSVIFLATSGYERVLMGISWGAITLTALDVILTADVRAEESE